MDEDNKNIRCIKQKRQRMLPFSSVGEGRTPDLSIMSAAL